MHTIHLTNLTRNTTKAHLQEIFAHFGKISGVDFQIDRRNNLPSSSADISYFNKDDAKKAIEYMNLVSIFKTPQLSVLKFKIDNDRANLMET